MINYKDQLKDDGAVIGYRPNLKTERENVTDSEQSSDSGITLLTSQTGNNNQYSKTLQGYLDNTPAKVLSDIKDLLSDLDNIKTRLLNEFNLYQFDKYSDINTFVQSIISNPEYAEEFKNYHNNIDGTVIPELLETIVKEEGFINKISDTLKELYYGNSTINLEDAQKKDNELINILTANDLAGSGNNYLLLAKDAETNKMISIFTDKIDSALLQLEDVAYITTEESINDSNLKDSLIDLYNDYDYEQSKRTESYNNQHLNLDTSTKSLYNYYDKRNKMNQYYTLMLNGASNSEYLMSKAYNYIKNTNKAIEEINKTLLSNVYYISKIDEYLSEKKKLSVLSATINYN